MYLQNPEFSTVDIYLKMLNKISETKVNLKYEYAFHNKSIGEMHYFSVGNLIEEKLSEGGILLSKQPLSGNLNFTYNEKLNILTINEVPTTKILNANIKILNDELLKIVSDKLKVVCEPEKVSVLFKKDAKLIAINNAAVNVLPDLKNTFEFKKLQNVLNHISHEEEKLKTKILQDKAKKEKEETAMNAAIRNKQSVFGVSPYEHTQEEFNELMGDRLIEIYSKRLNNIERHLKNNVISYLSNFDETITKSLNMGDEQFYNEYFDKVFNDYFEEINIDFYGISEKEQNEIIELLRNKYFKKQVDNKFVQRCEVIYKFNPLKDGIINVCEALIKNNKKLLDNAYEYRQEHKSLLNQYRRFYSTGLNYDIFLQMVYEDEIKNGIRIDENKNFYSKKFELLQNIKSLYEQHKYYKQQLENPENAISEFQNSSDKHFFKMQVPYFMVWGRDIKFRDDSEYHKPICNLLMIKPGVENVDLENMRATVYKNGFEFGRNPSTRKEIFNYVKNAKYKWNKLTVCLPKSLNFNEIEKIVNYSMDKSIHNGFVCETPDMARKVKSVLLNKYDKKEISNNQFDNSCIMVVPKYYDLYFSKTPRNVNYFFECLKNRTFLSINEWERLRTNDNTDAMREDTFNVFNYKTYCDIKNAYDWYYDNYSKLTYGDYNFSNELKWRNKLLTDWLKKDQEKGKVEMKTSYNWNKENLEKYIDNYENSCEFFRYLKNVKSESIPNTIIYDITGEESIENYDEEKVDLNLHNLKEPPEEETINADEYNEIFNAKCR